MTVCVRISNRQRTSASGSPFVVPVVRQYGEVAFALVQAMSVAFNYAVVVQGDLPLIEHSQAYLAYLLRIDSASIAADLASGLDHSGRWLCGTSDWGEYRSDHEEKPPYEFSVLAELGVPRGHLGHQPQHGVLEVVLLERIAAAQTTLLDVDRVGVRVFLGTIPRDETRRAVVTVDLQCPLAVGRAGERQNVPRI